MSFPTKGKTVRSILQWEHKNLPINKEIISIFELYCSQFRFQNKDRRSRFSAQSSTDFYRLLGRTVVDLSQKCWWLEGIHGASKDEPIYWHISQMATKPNAKKNIPDQKEKNQLIWLEAGINYEAQNQHWPIAFCGGVRAKSAQLFSYSRNLKPSGAE